MRVIGRDLSFNQYDRPVHTPAAVTRVVRETNLRGLFDRYGKFRVLDSGGERNVIMSLPRIKGYFDEKTSCSSTASTGMDASGQRGSVVDES